MLMTRPVESPRKATPLEIVKAVLSAFIGIRRRAAHERDAVTLTPAQAVIAGLLGAALLVAGLITLVRFIVG